MRKTKGKGLALRPESKRRRIFAVVCGGIDHIAYHSKMPTHLVIEELHAIKAHCDRRLIELLTEAATGEPRKRRQKD